jgi:hypothetical protein
MNGDLVSGVLLILAGILWAVVARHFVPLTRVGVLIVAVPSLMLTAMGVLRYGFYLMDRLRRRG